MLMRALSARANKIGAVLQAKRSMLSRITTPVELKRPVLDKKPGGTSPMPARSKKEVSQNSEPEVETTETHPSLKKLNITIVVALIGFAGTVIAGLLSSPWIGNLFSPEPASTLTITATSTLTPAPTMTSTSSETPTTTLTFTPSGPFSYIVQEGDTLDALANKFNLGPDGVLLILDYNPEIMRNNGVFFIGQELLIPSPGTIQSTRTPISPDLPRGTKVDYIVLPGDTLAGIAAKFNSSPNAIIDINGADVADVNNLFVGRHLQIPVNLVTATATLPPSSTPVTSASLPPTSTPVTAQ